MGLFCLGFAATFNACGDDDSSSGGKTEMVSCYIYNVEDAENNEIQESCTQAEKGTAYGDSIKAMCDLTKQFIVESDGDKVELGTGCKEEKALYTCGESTGSGDLEKYYYILDEDQKAAIKGLKKGEECPALIELDNEEIPDLDDEDDGDDGVDTDDGDGV